MVAAKSKDATDTWIEEAASAVVEVCSVGEFVNELEVVMGFPVGTELVMLPTLKVACIGLPYPFVDTA